MVNMKVKDFEAASVALYASVTAKIEEFEIRRLYNDYIVELNRFRKTVEQNDEAIAEINQQQADLKWKKTVFKAAEEIKRSVMPNCELWALVQDYDLLLKEWKNQEISQMKVSVVKEKISSINTKVSKLIKRLKNLSSLKIGYELQNDTKEVLKDQVQIIEIFSHPGLKERHWQLFNSKLMIPGVDLKDIPYSKIKIFY